MTIQIQHPFKKSELKHVEEFLEKHTKEMTITVHRLHAGQCWFEATSKQPLDFYKFGMYVATHLQVKAKLAAEKKLRRQQQEN